MTANVITYRGKSAAREVGKVLGIDTAQVDRLAKVMSQFEFVDPPTRCEADGRCRLRARSSDISMVRRALERACRICRATSASIPAAW
jgi:error-prone DNA polymerase